MSTAVEIAGVGIHGASVRHEGADQLIEDIESSFDSM